MTKRRPAPHTRQEALNRARAVFGVVPDREIYPAWIFDPEPIATFMPCVCPLDEWEIAPAFYLARHDLIQCYLCCGRVMCPAGMHGAMFCNGPGEDTLLYTDADIETYFRGLCNAEYPVGIFPRGLYLGCKRCCRNGRGGCPWGTTDEDAGGGWAA